MFNGEESKIHHCSSGRNMGASSSFLLPGLPPNPCACAMTQSTHRCTLLSTISIDTPTNYLRKVSHLSDLQNPTTPWATRASTLLESYYGDTLWFFMQSFDAIAEHILRPPDMSASRQSTESLQATLYVTHISEMSHGWQEVWCIRLSQSCTTAPLLEHQFRPWLPDLTNLAYS